MIFTLTAPQTIFQISHQSQTDAVVHATLRISLDAPLHDVKAIDVRFVAGIICKIVRKKATLRAAHTICDCRNNLLKNKTTLAKGTHEYNIRFAIPKNSPYSTVNPQFTIEYLIVAAISFNPGCIPYFSRDPVHQKIRLIVQNTGYSPEIDSRLPPFNINTTFRGLPETLLKNLKGTSSSENTPGNVDTTHKDLSCTLQKYLNDCQEDQRNMSNNDLNNNKDLEEKSRNSLALQRICNKLDPISTGSILWSPTRPCHFAIEIPMVTYSDQRFIPIQVTHSQACNFIIHWSIRQTKTFEFNAGISEGSNDGISTTIREDFSPGKADLKFGKRGSTTLQCALDLSDLLLGLDTPPIKILHTLCLVVESEAIIYECDIPIHLSHAVAAQNELSKICARENEFLDNPLSQTDLKFGKVKQFFAERLIDSNETMGEFSIAPAAEEFGEIGPDFEEGLIDLGGLRRRRR